MRIGVLKGSINHAIVVQARWLMVNEEGHLQITLSELFYSSGIKPKQ